MFEGTIRYLTNKPANKQLGSKHHKAGEENLNRY